MLYPRHPQEFVPLPSWHADNETAAFAPDSAVEGLELFFLKVLHSRGRPGALVFFCLATTIFFVSFRVMRLPSSPPLSLSGSPDENGEAAGDDSPAPSSPSRPGAGGPPGVDASPLALGTAAAAAGAEDAAQGGGGGEEAGGWDGAGGDGVGSAAPGVVEEEEEEEEEEGSLLKPPSGTGGLAEAAADGIGPVDGGAGGWGDDVCEFRVRRLSLFGRCSCGLVGGAGVGLEVCPRLPFSAVETHRYSVIEQVIRPPLLCRVVALKGHHRSSLNSGRSR